MCVCVCVCLTNQTSDACFPASSCRPASCHQRPLRPRLARLRDFSRLPTLHVARVARWFFSFSPPSCLMAQRPEPWAPQRMTDGVSGFDLPTVLFQFVMFCWWMAQHLLQKWLFSAPWLLSSLSEEQMNECPHWLTAARLDLPINIHFHANRVRLRSIPIKGILTIDSITESIPSWYRRYRRRRYLNSDVTIFFPIVSWS